MSQPKQLYNKVVEIISSDAVLSSYVDEIYERYRDNIDQSNRTVIMVEPSDIFEKGDIFPLEGVFVVIITGYIFESDQDKSINAGTNRGIMDLDQDIKNALRANYNLDGLCTNFKFTSTKFDIKKYSWGQKEKLRQPPLYGVTGFSVMDFIHTGCSGKHETQDELKRNERKRKWQIHLPQTLI